MKVLLKCPPGKSVSFSDSFSVHQGFTHTVKKVRIVVLILESAVALLRNTAHASQLNFIFYMTNNCSLLPNIFRALLEQFRVPMAFLDDTEPVLKNIEIERGTTIDAAIVRIMKTKKICNHVQLIAEILQHLSFFVPDPKLVKQRIEMLIEKEYLKRDIGDSKTYHYMP